MRMRDIRKLHKGDQVYWTDPDEGTCSRYLTISIIELKGDAVCITDARGNYLECLAKELS